MKWRSTAIYFLVLLIVGVTYFVMNARQKETERKEKESKRVFVFDAKTVKEIEIKPAGSEPIHLQKGENWRITRPIDSDVDKTLFADFYSALQNLMEERNIGKATDNLSAFGLDKPSLAVRLLTGENWLELRMGAKNPAETGRYATAGEGGDIFMVSNITFESLNKQLKDFRRKELFSWQPDQIAAMDVKWGNGGGFSLERQGGSKVWKSATQPEMEIKARKVQDLLDELHWLRAVDFTGKDAAAAAPVLDINLKLKNGQTAELKVASSDDKKKQAIASSSEIEGPVVVASGFLNSVPRSAGSLADRSLISSEASDVKQITWKTENSGGNLVRLEGDNWGTKEGNASPKALKNSAAVRSFLSVMENVEYIEAVEPGSKPPEDAPDSIQLVDDSGKNNWVRWEKVPAESADPITVWIERDGVARTVKAKREVVKKLDDSLTRLGTSLKAN